MLFMTKSKKCVILSASEGSQEVLHFVQNDKGIMLEDVQKIHVIGVGGIGISAAAKFLLARGKTVSGSDLHPSAITKAVEQAGGKVFSGHAASNVADGTELVIYSPAVLESNVERVHAKELGIPQMSYPEFLGELSKDYSTIVVTGTNGKSTTTAMVALMLEEAGYDPTVIVGSLVPSFPQGNLRLGKGRFLVVEGCEYRAHMLHLNPEMIVLTNIEEDHLDYYRDLDHIRETFQTFVDKLIGKGLLVHNGNDPESKKLAADRAVTFGYKTKTDYASRNRKTEMGKQSFMVFRSGEKEETLGRVTLNIPGAFNMMNALAAISAALELGVPFETCQRVLENFTGIWRRFERVGVWKGADVISDYGHHPTAIRDTIAAAREFFPQRRIVLCFQPHQHSRTKELLDQFVETVHDADAIVVPEIYKVVGRTEKEESEVSSRDLVNQIKKKDPAKEIHHAKDLKEAEKVLRDLVKPADVLIIQGAGDVDDLARKIAA